MEIDREPGLPRIEMDYGILKVSEQDNHAKGPRAWATFLVAVHVGTGMSCAIAVEHKGKHGLAVAENVPQSVTPNPYTVSAVVSFIEYLCLSDVVLRSDGEPAIKELASSVRYTRLRSGWKTHLQESAPHNSQSKGCVESTLGYIAAQC